MFGLFHLRYALRSLRRSGQRTMLALLCVAFGVMSLTAMQILAKTISDTIMMDPRLTLGGDIQIDRPNAYLTADDMAQLDALRAEGTIEDYTLTATRTGSLLKRPDSGHIFFVMRAMGVDPASYPLLGTLALKDPTGAALSDVLAEPGSAAITRDLANRLDLHVGDRFSLTGETGGIPVDLHVTAIIDSTPDRAGDRVLYNLETASLAVGRPSAVTSASILLGNQGDTVARLRDSGWQITTPEDIIANNRNVRDVFDLMLKGAGILGLLVGGIGVANTMQVLLARRTTEIATLKTLGYRQRDLIGLFGLETALMGIAGSVLGVGAAILFSIPLLDSFARTGSMLLEWSVEPAILAGGLLSGIVTAVIFGIYAILRASAVRPAVLLRNLPVLKTWRRRFQTLGIYAALAIPFGLLSSMIMGSLLWGAIVIGVAVVGLIVLGLVLGTVLFIAVRLPMPNIRLFALARNNLRRQKMRTVFALIALFVGVFAIGFSAATILSARAEFNSRMGSITGYNVAIFANNAQNDAITTAIAQQSAITESHARYEVPIDAAVVTDGTSTLNLDMLRLEGRADGDVTWDLALSGETWGTVPNGVYLPEYVQWTSPNNSNDTIAPGMQVTVTTAQGKQRIMTVAGFYTHTDMESLAMPPSGLIASQDVAFELGGPSTTVTYILAVPENQLRSATESMGRALPGATVVSAADVQDVMMRLLKNVFLFAVSVAGLALAAGAVLIANSVGLAMVERRREVGILKAVGYSSGDVLSTLLIEHAIVGLLAGAIGIAGVYAAIFVLRTIEPRATLTLAPLPALGIVLASMAIALTSAAAVAWRPTHVRPLVVLRDE